MSSVGMSRPPTHTDTNFMAANRRGIIDFVGAPVNTIFPTDDMYMQAGYAPIGPSQPVFTMAGYPPGPGQPAGYVQAPYPVQAPPSLPGFPATFTNSPYYTYSIGPNTAPNLAQQSIAAKPPITEENLQQKVDAKIESIMSAHKADMLSQQISRLTDKVQKLSNNIELKKSGISSSSIDSDETEMSRRLRKLAAESSRRAVPDGQTNF
jgi:hypothetical protein